MLQTLNETPTDFTEDKMKFVITSEYKKAIQNIKIFFGIFAWSDKGDKNLSTPLIRGINGKEFPLTPDFSGCVKM